MPRKKHQYTPKEHRQVEHIKESEMKRGVSEGEAEAIGYATVTKANPGQHHFTKKEDAQAEHIMESEEERGKSEPEAKRIAYATINKQRNKR